MNVLVLFTYGTSIMKWKQIGLLDREIRLYKELMKKNIKVSFLTYGDKKDLMNNELLKDFDIFPVKNMIQSKNFVLRFLKSLLLPIKLKEIFKRTDIIKTNQIEGWWVSILAKMLYRKKLIIRGGYDWLMNFAGIKPKNGVINLIKYLFKYCYIYLLEFFAFRFADHIFLTSHYYIEFIIKAFRLKRYKKKINYIPNFIDTNLFQPLNVEKKKHHILYIGRFIIEKNLYNLIKALKNQNDYKLDMIGFGPLKDELKKLAQNLGVQIKIMDTFPNNKLPEIYNRYELFILPSYFEGNPKSLLEAMSCGVPCIGTNVRGIDEIIINGYNGYLCKTDYNSIRETIQILYKNKDGIPIMCQNARESIINNFSLNLLTNKEYKIYQNILNLKNKK